MVIAIHFINTRGIYHRDLKPANFLMSKINDRIYLNLNDFGIARVVNATKSHIQTDTGQFGGTARYNSPERI
jgi:serine/threonine protein kinase